MNVTDLYSTRIQKTFDDDHAEILSILKANPKKSLKLINYYKELPLSYSAKIVSIDKGIVDLDIQKEQAFAIEASRSTFIRSDLFKYDVFAQAQYVNVLKGAASFVKLSYVEIMAERRNFIRMAPQIYSAVTIDSPFGVFDGKLYDISLSGLNILIEESIPLEIDTSATINFILENVERDQIVEVNVKATLLDIKGDVLPRKYKFTITPEKPLERKLSKYIFQRQIEIIREIKDAIS